jgi:hypothetical protein
MSFASSLLALSIHSLAAQADQSAHNGIEAAYANFFTAMGGKVQHQVKVPVVDSTDGRKMGRIDIMVDFGEFQVILEVSSHEGSQMSFVQTTTNKITGRTYRCDSHHNKVKQVLVYASKMQFTKPTICMVASNLEFLAFNPNSFNIKKFRQQITVAPSVTDRKAASWVKNQRAFKVMKKHKVESLATFTKERFITYLRAIAELPTQPELRLVAE